MARALNIRDVDNELLAIAKVPVRGSRTDACPACRLRELGAPPGSVLEFRRGEQQLTIEIA